MDVTHQFVPEKYSVLDSKNIIQQIENLLDFVDQVEYDGHNNDFGWAHETIIANSLSFVRVGILAEQIRRYRLYQHTKEKFNSFKDYCEKGLGRLHWHIKQIIKAARVCIDLARMGFDTLPQNYSQALCLSKYYDQELASKWDEILKQIPPHRITAIVIDRIANGKEPNKQNVRLKKGTYRKLIEQASVAGLSVDEYLDSLINGLESEPEPPPEEKSEEKPTPKQTTKKPITRHELNRWLADMQQLLVEEFGLLDVGTPGEPCDDTC